VGGVFYDQGQARDPFRILKDHGANLVRVRPWHTPPGPTTAPWPTRAHDPARPALGMRFTQPALLRLLGRPCQAERPAAWAALSDIDQLERAVYYYTYTVLDDLNAQGLIPYVQVGNEINTESCVGAPHNGASIDWAAQRPLINAGNQRRCASPGTPPAADRHVPPDRPANRPAGKRRALVRCRPGRRVHDFDVIGFPTTPNGARLRWNRPGKRSTRPGDATRPRS
jgi:arabinogalactan endo-1,4-beta-galactosidase